MSVESSRAVVVTSATADMKYSQFVRRWIEVWRLYGDAYGMSIEPRVLSPEPSAPSAMHVAESMIHFPPERISPLAFQAQVNRLLATRWLDVPDDSIVFAADVDMFPGADSFCHRLIRGTPRDSFLIGRDVLSREQQFPMCYLSATVATWRAAFEHVTDSGAVWAEWSQPDVPQSDWFIDQRLAYRELLAFSRRSGKHLIRWSDGASGHTRLDRAHYSPQVLWRAQLRTFSDYHAHRNPAKWRPIVRVIERRLRRTAAAMPSADQ